MLLLFFFSDFYLRLSAKSAAAVFDVYPLRSTRLTSPPACSIPISAVQPR
jgi:hypothetical protein